MADTVETAANTVIGTLISVPMIRANQNGERPDLPYATYQVTTRTTQGRDEYLSASLEPIAGRFAMTS